MHKEILNDSQMELLPLIKEYKREFYLVGGTAIALYLGHRRSIDFDLFKSTKFNVKKILSKMEKYKLHYRINRNVAEQLNLVINGVKFTFFEYPFQIPHSNTFENTINLPNLLDLAAMKAYALGRRSKWKDYVDLYFIIKYHYNITQIAQRASEIYDQLFSEKLFVAQLSYFQDIDYTEEVEFLVEPVSDDEIKDFLLNAAIDIV